VTQPDTRITPEETIALLEETLEATHEGLLVFALDRRIVRYNSQFLRMFGLTGDELQRGGIDAFAAVLAALVDDEGRITGHLADPWMDSSVERLDTLRLRDGRVLERFIAPHRLAGRIIGRVASYRDITQTVRAETALEQHRAFLEKAQEVAHIGSWIVELDESRRLQWSQETFRIFGADPGTFRGHEDEFLAFVHPDDRDAVEHALRATIDERAPYDIEHRIVRADWSTRWVHERADVLRDAAGTPLRMIGTVQDITERRHLEEQLRQSQRIEAIGRLAGGIAHDLNNSLTAIMGYTEMALSAMDAGHPARGDVDEIRRAASRAEAVTRQLLAFSRKQILDPRPFSMTQLLTSMRPAIEQALGSSVAFSLDTRSVTSPVYGDPRQIEHAVLAIVANAREAMPRGGSVSVWVGQVTLDAAFVQRYPPMPPGTYIEVRIADDGPGMDAATQARIFEPFFTTKESGAGLGLGLAMVYGTVRQIGGFVYVTSEPGVGASFSLYFPPAAAAQRVTPAAAPSAAGDGARILVAEDEPAIRAIVGTTLRRRGYRVLLAGSAEEALDLVNADEEAIDLLVTDASMPGMSGLELAQKLAARQPTLRVIVMSGFTEESLRLRDAGIAAVLLPKPFRPADLQQLVAETLAGKAPSHS
jgi:PAS domain S-box-containing protein